MIEIECPFCGPRPHTEFSYGGEAEREPPPAPEALAATEWLDHVYLRDNPAGAHWEWWQHVAGCRRWLRVRRDTRSHEVLGCEPARGAGR